MEKIKQYIDQRKREYDPLTHPTDKEVECCVICLEEYKTDTEI